MVISSVSFARSATPLRLGLVGILAVTLVSGTRAAAAQEWPQWGRGPGHAAASSVPAQSLDAILADYVYDPFVSAATAEAGGNLLAHYPVPLLDGPDVYMELKTGSYVSCSPPGSGQPSPCGPAAWNTQIWNVAKLQWTGAALAPVWTVQTDWKPEPDAGALRGWEPVFHPVLAGGFLWAPGGGGSVFRVAKDTGAAVRIAPFGAAPLDPSIFVAGGLAADASGNVYYNAIRLDMANPWGSDALGAWLVQVRPDGSFHTATFASLMPGAPGASDSCETTVTGNLPFPPDPAAGPPTAPCGSQRPGLNAIPAVAADGTVFTVSRAHFNPRYGYLVAAGPGLAPKWAASLRDHLSDGCNVLLPPNGMPGGCRDGTATGVDPSTNRAPAGQVIDLSTSSPVALPDGGVLYGAYTSYNYRRGHLFRFDAQGVFTASYDFGWDITPAVRPHDGTYSIILKDNHYEVGSYCFNSAFCPPEPGRYDLVSLGPDLKPEWTFTNTNTRSCERLPDGSIFCRSDHPDSFEWCVNQPAVDSEGVIYANSEDGYLYAINPNGTLRKAIFLKLALGAAYTPLSIAGSGIIYTQNDGHLFAVGNPLRANPLVRPRRPAPHHVPGPRASARVHAGN